VSLGAALAAEARAAAAAEGASAVATSDGTWGVTVGDDSALYDVATASVIGRCKRFQAIVDANIQLDPSISGAVSAAIAACDAWTQRAMALSPSGAPILAVPRPLLAAAQEIRRRYIGPSADYPEVRDRLNPAVCGLINALLGPEVTPAGAGGGAGSGGADGAPAGDGGGGGGSGGEAVGALPPTLFLDVLGCLDFELAPCIEEFRGSIALRTVLQAIVDAAPTLASIGALPGGSGTGAGGGAAALIGLSAGFGGDAASAMAAAAAGAAGAAIAFLDADPRAGLVGSISETTVKRGMVARFHAAKLNRYHRWQPRIFTIRLDTGDVMVHEVAGEGSHRFRLSSIQQAERITKDLTAKQLKITFNRAAVGPDLTDKEYQLRFEDNATRETFCTLLHLLEPDVPVTDDSLHFLGAGRVAYDVLLLTRGGVKQRRVLTLDTRTRLLSRSRPDPAQGDWKAAATAAAASSAAGGGAGAGGGASGPGAGLGGPGAASGGDTDDEDEGHGSGGASHRHPASTSTAAAAAAGQQRDLPITVSTRLEPSPLDPTRLKLLFGGAGEASSETFEVCFPCHAAREHFAGTLRTLTYNVDAAAARVLGVHRAGIAPDVLTVWVGTFNCGETRPPKDVASLGAWVPAHRYDVLAIGLQECNARDDWVRAFEWLLATANAPAAGAEPPPLARFCAPPGPPSRDAGSGGGGGGGSNPANAQVVGWGDGDDDDGPFPGAAASGGGAPASGGKGGGSGGKGVKRIFTSMFGGSRGAGSVAGSFTAATTAAVAAVLSTASATMTSASPPLQSAPGASPYGVPSQPSFAFATANPAFGSGGGGSGGGTRPASGTYSAGGGGGSFAVPSTTLPSGGGGGGGASSSSGGRRGANSTGKEGGEEEGYGAVGASYTRAQLGMREPTELIGFSREVLTGVIHAPAAHSRSISMGSINAASMKRAAAAAGAGAEGGGGGGGHLSGGAGASSTRVSSKASRMLGFGGGGGGGGGAGGGGAGSGLPGRDKDGAAGAAIGVAGSERVIHSSMLTPAASAAGGGAGGESGGSGRTSRPDPPVAVSPYVTVSVTTLWGIHLLLFARASVAQHISQVQSGTAATGIGGVLGNKGGVATGLVYRESTSIAFVTSHLAARAERVRERGDDYSEICRALRLSTSPFAGQFLHQYDHVLWCGDLNYRTDMGAMGTAEEFQRVQAAIAARDWALLTAADQLGRELESGRIFQGFSEGRIAFAPTYRMEKGRDEYSNKKHQNASYTDRVLWRSRAGLQANVAQLHYDACYAVNQSDHRPVGAGFLLAATLPYMCLQRSDIGERGSGISGGSSSSGAGPGSAAAATSSASAAAPSSAAAAAGAATAGASAAAGPSSGAGGLMGPAAAAILNRGGCALNVSYLRYDDVVLGRGEQIAAEAGLDVSAAIEGVQRTRHKAVLASILAVTASQQAAAGGGAGDGADRSSGPSESSPVNRGTSGSSAGGITASDWGVPLSPGAGGGEGWGPDDDGGGKASSRARSAGNLSASPGTTGSGSGGNSSIPAPVTVTAGRLAFPSGATALPPYLARSIAASGGAAAAGAGGSAASVSATATAASAALAAATSTVSGASGVNPDSYYCEISAPWLEEGVSTGFGVAAPTGAAAAAAVASYLGSAGFGGASSGAGVAGTAGGAADGAAAGGAAASAGAGGPGALSVSNPAVAAAVAGSTALTALAAVGEAAAAAAAAAGGSTYPGGAAPSSAAGPSAAQAVGPYGGVAGLAASGGGGGSMAAALAAAAPSNLGSVSAQWLPEAIPDMVAALPDPKWLAGQVLRISLKRRGGTLIGQADVSLRDAFLCSEAELPLAPEALTLHAVMEHPVLAGMFGAFTASNLSSESLDFYRSHLAFQELCSAGPHVATAEVRIAAAHVICDTFLWSTAPRMVSVSGTLIAKLKTALAKADEAYGIVSVTPAGGSLASAHSSASLLGLPSGVGGGLSSPQGSTRRLLGGVGGSGRSLTSVGDSLPGFTAGASAAGLAAPVKGGLPAAGMASTPEEAAALVERYAPSDLLHEAAVEVFRAMERDNLPGFRQLYSRIVAACGLHYGAVPASASAAAAAAATAGSAAGGAAPAGPTTPCAPFCVPLLRDGCTVGVLRGALQLTPQDVLGDRVQRLKELHRFLRRRSTVAAARRNTAAGGGESGAGGAAAGRGGAAGGGTQRGVVGGMLIEDGMALPGGGGGGGGSAGGRSSIVPGGGTLGGRGAGGAGSGVGVAPGAGSGGGGGGGLVLNSMATYTRLPAGEQARVRCAVDHLLGPVVAGAAPGATAAGAAGGQAGGGVGAAGASVPSSSLPAPPGTEAGDDFLLLADVLLGAAVAERDALPSSAAAGSHGEAQAQAAVLARAAAMATAASGGDASIPTRALRSLLQLALQRVNALEEQLHGAQLQPQQQHAPHYEASRADRW
jgi:hypothetical protein